MNSATKKVRGLKTVPLVVGLVMMILTVLPAFAGNIDVSVPGTAGPWIWVNGGLNTNYQYGVGDEGAPIVISSAEGFNFTPGSTITLNYLSGLVSAGSGFPSVDANGDTNVPFNDQRGSSGTFAPSFYMDHNSYPIYLVELVGTFTNSAGQIVGTPFKIGDSANLIVPVGATQLQLGANDDIYSDNTGAWEINVSEAGGGSTPEPSSFLLFGSGLCGMVGVLRRRLLP